MYPGVTDVKVLDNYKLLLTFDNKEQKVFDMSPFLGKGVFRELRDEKVFSTVHVSFDTIEWSNGADLCPEILYRESSTTQ